MTLFRQNDDTFIVGEGDLINKKELIAILGVSKASIQRWMRIGMPYTPYKNFNGYEIAKVEAWLKEQNYGNPQLIRRWREENKRMKEGQ
jgi:hypothetical protein